MYRTEGRLWELIVVDHMGKVKMDGGTRRMFDQVIKATPLFNSCHRL